MVVLDAKPPSSVNCHGCKTSSSNTHTKYMKVYENILGCCGGYMTLCILLVGGWSASYLFPFVFLFCNLYFGICILYFVFLPICYDLVHHTGWWAGSCQRTCVCSNWPILYFFPLVFCIFYFFQFDMTLCITLAGGWWAGSCQRTCVCSNWPQPACGRTGEEEFMILHFQSSIFCIF